MIKLNFLLGFGIIRMRGVKGVNFCSGEMGIGKASDSDSQG